MDGVLNFLKPPGITSHDAVAICRRILKEKRIGHSGTLDPMAYGVLPIFLGKATRLIEYTEGFDKIYVAEGCFGSFTDTEDSSGQLVLPDMNIGLANGVILNQSSSDVSSLVHISTMDELATVFETFLGEQTQRPSKYSAIKINGIRAYEYARKGIDVELPTRQVHIKSIELLAYAFPYFTVRITCSSGTYIRSLLRDFFVKVGIPGTMTQLCRSQVGQFLINEAYMAEELMVHGENLVQPVDTALSFLSKVEVNDVQLIEMKQGKELAITDAFSHTVVHQLYRAYGPQGFIGIMRRTPQSMKVEKNIFI